MTQARDRAGQAGLGLAFAGHLLLFGLLSIAWGQQKPPPPPLSAPVEVSLVTDVAPEAQAPAATEPPSPSIAPEAGAPEDAPPAPAEIAPTPPAPAAPAPPAPATHAPTKPAPPAPAKPVAAKPATKPAPAPKPVPVKSQPAPAARPAPAKSAPAKPAPAKPAPAKPAPVAARPSRLAGIVASVANGATPSATAARPRGARLGDDFLKGLSPDAPKRPASAAAAGKAGPYPTASIVGAIARQIQPCADRQVNPGPGANRIVTTLNVRLNADGTLAATPTKVRQSGVNDENERYAQRVVDLGIAAFKGCSPLKLPSEYYQTASGGWNNINYQWQLR